MQSLDPAFIQSLQAARDGAIAPVYFIWVRGKTWDTGADVTMGLWSGDEDITINVQTPTGGLASRSYIGGVNLEISDLRFVADLTDNPVTATMSQLAPATQQLLRGMDIRLGYCEIHTTSWNGGALTSTPQLQWIGVVDEGAVATPGADDDGNISLTIRSELMAQLTAINPAKSSHSHQQRRQSTDRFSRYSGIIASRKIQWYKE